MRGIARVVGSVHERLDMGGGGLDRREQGGAQGVAHGGVAEPDDGDASISAREELDIARARAILCSLVTCKQELHSIFPFAPKKGGAGRTGGRWPKPGAKRGERTCSDEMNSHSVHLALFYRSNHIRLGAK